MLLSVSRNINNFLDYRSSFVDTIRQFQDELSFVQLVAIWRTKLQVSVLFN